MKDTENTPLYTEVTRSIRVSVEPVFLPDQSRPLEGRFVWAYIIQIDNEGPETVQLLSRHWHITDALGRTEEVRGPGVVGEQPVLQPGESFRYNSGVPLPTPSGRMVGTYEMTTEAGERFDVAIPAFALESPRRHLH